MAGGRRGLVAPQNTFLENIIRRSNSQREFFCYSSHRHCDMCKLYFPLFLLKKNWSEKEKLVKKVSKTWRDKFHMIFTFFPSLFSTTTTNWYSRQLILAGQCSNRRLSHCLLQWIILQNKWIQSSWSHAKIMPVRIYFNHLHLSSYEITIRIWFSSFASTIM